MQLNCRGYPQEQGTGHNSILKTIEITQPIIVLIKIDDDSHNDEKHIDHDDNDNIAMIRMVIKRINVNTARS